MKKVEYKNHYFLAFFILKDQNFSILIEMSKILNWFNSCTVFYFFHFEELNFNFSCRGICFFFLFGSKGSCSLNFSKPLEAKRYQNNSQSHVFYGVWKLRPFLPFCRAAEKNPRFSNSVKNRGFESCSNIFSPLVTLMAVRWLLSIS